MVSRQAAGLVRRDKRLTWKAASTHASAGFGGEPALALIDAVMCPSCEWRFSNARVRRRCSDEEMVPDDPASLGREAICLQPLQSGLQSPLSQRAVSNVFSTPASSDEGAFLSMPGRGLHDVAMGNPRSAPVRAAQGILRFGRQPFHAHRPVMGLALSGGCLTSFWRAARKSGLLSLRERDPPTPDCALTLAKKAPRITPESSALCAPQELVESSCVAMLLF